LWSAKAAESARVKYWEIIADNLSKAGFSLGWVSAPDVEGRTIWIVDAHGYGNRSLCKPKKSWQHFWKRNGRFTTLPSVYCRKTFTTL